MSKELTLQYKTKENNKLKNKLSKSTFLFEDSYLKINDDDSKFKDFETIKYDNNNHDINNNFVCNFHVTNDKLKNINFSNRDDLEGITIDRDYAKSRINMDIFLEPNHKIKQLNIITKNGVKTIKLENTSYKISFTSFIYYKFNSLLIDKYDSDKNIKESFIYHIYDDHFDTEYSSYYLDETDIENNVLDLRKFDNYKTIGKMDNIKINNPQIKLIINNNTIKKNIELKDILIDTLEIIDEDEMRLMPKITDTDLHYSKTCSIKCENNLMSVNSGSKMRPKLIYVNENMNIKIIDENYLRKKYENCKNINFIKDDSLKPTIIIECNNKDIVIIDDKEYIVTKLFKRYVDLYKERKERAEQSDFSIYYEENYNSKSFIEDYNKYIKFLEYLKHLKNIGFTNKALYYIFLKRHLNDRERILEYYKEFIKSNDRIFYQEIVGINEHCKIFSKKYLKRIVPYDLPKIEK